jgi:HlyD family secretion protein
VIFKAADVGKTVQASFSAPTLFVIAQDLRKMQIIAPISEVDIWAVKSGQEATFTVEALPDRVFHGLLRQIRNPYTPSEKQANQPPSETTSSIATFDAVIEVDNPDLVLLPSLTANVSVVVDRHKGVIRLPNSALRVQIPASAAGNSEAGAKPAPTASAPEMAQGTATVYRLPGGDRNATPESVPIHLGISDSIITEVVSGLKEGDTVVTGTIKPPYEYHNSFF